MRITRLAKVTALAALPSCSGLLATPLQSQTMVVPDRLVCSTCTIVFDTVLTLGGIDGPGIQTISDLSRVAVDGQGRILVAGFSVPEIGVFDSTGSWIRTVGGTGDGPGEYRWISHITAGPRYVHVFDPTKGRTLLDSEFNVIRTDRFPGEVLSSIVLPSEDVIFYAHMPTARAVGHPLHTLTVSGELTSYGGDAKTFRGRPPSHVIAGSESVIWTAEQGQNRITRWERNPHIRRVMTFERRVAAFDRDNPASFSWPRSLIRAIRLDEDGLWVVWHTPDREWTDRQTESGPIPSEPMGRILDGWLDLVDPETGQTIARRRLDDVLLGFASGSDYVVVYHETEQGVPFLHLARPRLIHSPPDPRPQEESCPLSKRSSLQQCSSESVTSPRSKP